MRASHGDSKVSELLKRKPSHKDVQPLRRKARQVEEPRFGVKKKIDAGRKAHC